MILGRSALVLIFTIVIAAAPWVSTSFGLPRGDAPAYAAVAAAPNLQDDNEEDEDLDNGDEDLFDNESDESDNDGEDGSDNDSDEGSDNDGDDSSDNDGSDSNVLDLNSNAALKSDTDNSSGDNDNSFDFDDNDNSGGSNDNGGNPNSLTATGSVGACLQTSQQVVLNVPEGRVILRNHGPAVQVALARIDLAAAPLPPQPGPRLGGQNGLAFNLAVAACGGAALAALPGPADLAVQYNNAAAAGVNEANLKAATLQPGTNLWVPVPSQRNSAVLNEVVAQVTAPGTYSVHNGHP